MSSSAYRRWRRWSAMLTLGVALQMSGCQVDQLSSDQQLAALNAVTQTLGPFLQEFWRQGLAAFLF